MDDDLLVIYALDSEDGCTVIDTAQMGECSLEFLESVIGKDSDR